MFSPNKKGISHALHLLWATWFGGEIIANEEIKRLRRNQGQHDKLVSVSVERTSGPHRVKNCAGKKHKTGKRHKEWTNYYKTKVHFENGPNIYSHINSTQENTVTAIMRTTTESEQFANETISAYKKNSIDRFYEKIETSPEYHRLQAAANALRAMLVVSVPYDPETEPMFKELFTKPLTKFVIRNQFKNQGEHLVMNPFSYLIEHANEMNTTFVNVVDTLLTYHTSSIPKIEQGVADIDEFKRFLNTTGKVITQDLSFNYPTDCQSYKTLEQSDELLFVITYNPEAASRCLSPITVIQLNNHRESLSLSDGTQHGNIGLTNEQWHYFLITFNQNTIKNYIPNAAAINALAALGIDPLNVASALPSGRSTPLLSDQASSFTCDNENSQYDDTCYLNTYEAQMDLDEPDITNDAQIIIYDRHTRGLHAMQQAWSYQFHALIASQVKSTLSFFSSLLITTNFEFNTSLPIDAVINADDGELDIFYDPSDNMQDREIDVFHDTTDKINYPLLLEGIGNYEPGHWYDSLRQDLNPIQHPRTGEPIFTFRAYQGRDEVGSISFYKHPLLCKSESGDRHNLYKTEGIFDDVIINTDNIEEICAAFPPTFWDDLIDCAMKGMPEWRIAWCKPCSSTCSKTTRLHGQ